MNCKYVSLLAQRGPGVAERIARRADAQLASGLRINQATDVTAGMSISETLNNHAGGLGMAHWNVQDASSMMPVAGGALTETHPPLSGLREPAVQACSDILHLSDRLSAIAGFTASYAEIDRIGRSPQFDGIVLMDTNSGASSITPQMRASRGLSLTHTMRAVMT